MNEADDPVVGLSPCVRLFVGWLREEGFQVQCERPGEIHSTSRAGPGSADRERSEQSRLATSGSCISGERMTSTYHGKHTHRGLR